MKTESRSERVRCLLIGTTSFVWLLTPAFNRSYLYDESVTVGLFVETDSVSNALTQQVVFNNHVGMSTLAHALYRLGVGGPLAYRSVVAMFGALTVVLTYRLGREHFSDATGLWAAALVLANPAFRAQSFQVRGWTPMLALVVLCTLYFCEYLGQRRRELPVKYWIAVVAAVLFNLYALVPLGVHGLVLLASTPTGWVASAQRLAGSALVAVLLHAGVLPIMLQVERPRRFRPDLPLDVATTLLGEYWWTVPVVAVCVALGMFQLAASHKEIRYALGALVAAFLMVWVVLAPFDSYPRMWIWLLPGAALLAAIGVDGDSRLRIPVAAALVLSFCASGWNTAVGTDRSSEDLGLVLSEVGGEGRSTCAIGYSNEPLLAYHEAPGYLSETQLATCDVVFALPRFAESFSTLDLDSTYAATAADGSVRFLVGWDEPVGRSSPALARLVTSETSSRRNNS